MSRPEMLITLDVDWAPDWMIDRTAEVLLEHQAKATWFITHTSPAVERLAETPALFELGLHPNCLPGSSHGDTDEQVLTHIRRLVPEAVSMRTHGLYQSTNFLAVAARAHGVMIDASLLLPHASHLCVVKMQWGDTVLHRAPCFWEDDVEMQMDDPIWDLNAPVCRTPGLKIFNFHPVHLALNTTDLGLYERLKAKRSLPEWDREWLQKHRNEGSGPDSIFKNLACRLSGQGRIIRELISKVDAK